MASDGGVRHSFTFVGGGNISTIGGIVRTITQIANHLVQQGHEVRYLAKLRPDSQPFYDLDERVILEPIDYPHSSSQIPRFASRLRELETDVLIVALSGKLALNVMVATQGLPFPIVRSEHGNPKSLLKSDLVWNNDQAARASTFQLADYSHLLYPEFADDPDLGEAIKTTLQAIPSPVELDVKQANPATPSREGKYKIIYSGRIEKFEKQADLLLKGFLRLAPDFLDWECHFLGDGILKPELEAICDNHPNGKQVIFHGSVEEDILFNHLASAHIFIMPSDTEGCPMALGEALAHGLPAIGFADCEGVNRMIIHEQNGLLVGGSNEAPSISPFRQLEEANASVAEVGSYEKQATYLNELEGLSSGDEIRINSLANTMKILMAEPKLRSNYGINAPETMGRYERTKVLGQWSDFLENIARDSARIKEQRELKYLNYPELLLAPKIAEEAVKRFNPGKKSKSFIKKFVGSMLQGRMPKN